MENPTLAPEAGLNCKRCHVKFEINCDLVLRKTAVRSVREQRLCVQIISSYIVSTTYM